MGQIHLIAFPLLFLAVASNYTFYENVNKFYKFYKTPQLWHEASKACRQENARLAMPRNANEARILKDILNDHPASSLKVSRLPDYAMLGFHDAFTEGIYQTENGETFRETYFSMWAVGQPDNYKNEDCGSIHRSGGLNDFPCDLPGVFICERGQRDLYIREPPLRLSSDSEYFLNEAAGKYYKFHRKARTWQNAVLTCRREGAELAMPDSTEEAEALRDIFSGYPVSSLPGLTNPDLMLAGFHDAFIKGKYLDLKGDYLSRGFWTWGIGQPDNTGGNENCGSLHSTIYLNDIPCNLSTVFICQKDIMDVLRQKTNLYSHLDTDYAYYPEVNLYYKFHEDPKMWQQASHVCRDEGSTLALPADAKQAGVLRHILARYPADGLVPDVYKDRILLGFNDMKDEGKYITEDGRPIEKFYNIWAEGKPNKVGGAAEDCGSMNRWGGLSDLPCTVPTVFICQKNSLSLSTTKFNDLYYSFKNNRQYHLHVPGLNWSEADRTCKEEKAWLSVVNSAEEAEFLAGVMKLHDIEQVLVGITTHLFDGLFTNNEGVLVQHLGYNLWSPGEKSNSNQCGALRQDRRLASTPCDTSTAFICEKRIQPDEPSIANPIATNYTANGCHVAIWIVNKTEDSSPQW